ncbi:MAG: hypothetical protein K0U98_00160 [Deltaproteobacteria bacterium]|nr:hypothetical protein [Deltaproteobacteria bacterium]
MHPQLALNRTFAPLALPLFLLLSFAFTTAQGQPFSQSAPTPTGDESSGSYLRLSAPGTAPINSFGSPSSGMWKNGGFVSTHRIPVHRPGIYVLYAMPPLGTVVGTSFTGFFEGNGSNDDAANAAFHLLFFDSSQTLTVTGTDLGWSGSGDFGPTDSPSEDLFNGSLISTTRSTLFWETLNTGPGGGGIKGSTSGGHFKVAVEEPSPVALVASYTPAPGAPRVLAASYDANPNFEISYFFDEDQGNWVETPDGPCHQGQNNPDYFRVFVRNLTGQDIDSCRFQLSWGNLVDCSSALVQVLNDPSQGSVALNTDDALIDPSTCQTAVPLQGISPSGQQTSLWAEFIIGGVSYEREILFTKQ